MSEKIKKNKMVLYLRTGVQLIFFFLLPSLFIQIFLSIKAIMMLLLHHQGTFQGILPNIILLAVATIVTVFGGRFFCGWMCAFGSMGDFLYKIPRLKNKKPRKYLLKADSGLKALKYLLLAAIVVLIWGVQIVSLPTGVNPWDLFGMLVSLGNLPSFNELIEGWIPAVIILGLIMTASLFVERFFCRYLCPLGAYFSIVSKLRPLKITKKRENCGSCTLCTQKCSVGIDLTTVDKVTTGECINCMECTTQCPRGNAQMQMSGENTNAAVAGVLSCTLVVGSYYLGNFLEDKLADSSGNSIAITAQANTSAGIAAQIPDGTYVGKGNGFRGETTVSTVVVGGIITSIAIESTDDDLEYMDRASAIVIDEIIANQSTDVDAVSGATYSSNAIISAVTAALATDNSAQTSATALEAVVNAQENSESETSGSVNEEDSAYSSLADGTYTGSGTGFRGETKVSVEVTNGKIADIAIDSYEDDREWFERASTTVIEEIISNQSVDVDAVSGATYSSNGIKEAVANALNLSFTPSTVQNEGSKHGGKGHK